MDKDILQLVERDAIEDYPQGGEREQLRGSHEKEIVKPFATVHGSNLDCLD